MKKHRNIVTKFIIGLIGEILIHSSMICALYGFIDERGWKFNRAFAELDFTLLIYNIVTDMIYTKLIYIGMLLKTVILLYKTRIKMLILMIRIKIPTNANILPHCHLE